jgi:hypothetical protein
VKNLGGRDGLLGYLAPPRKPAARQVYRNLTAPTTDARGRVVAAYDYSILDHYNAFVNGHCGVPGEPASWVDCPCGSWTDVHHGVWRSYSYHCGGLLAGGACCTLAAHSLSRAGRDHVT